MSGNNVRLLAMALPRPHPDSSSHDVTDFPISKKLTGQTCQDEIGSGVRVPELPPEKRTATEANICSLLISKNREMHP